MLKRLHVRGGAQVTLTADGRALCSDGCKTQWDENTLLVTGGGGVTHIVHRGIFGTTITTTTATADCLFIDGIEVARREATECAPVELGGCCINKIVVEDYGSVQVEVGALIDEQLSLQCSGNARVELPALALHSSDNAQCQISGRLPTKSIEIHCSGNAQISIAS